MTAPVDRGAFEFEARHTSEVKPVQQIKGGHRRVLADGDRMMLVEWRFEPGASVPEHAHPHEQSGYVISGTMLFTVNGEERAVDLGTGYLIPGNVPHSARFEEFTVLIDVFSPPREDYRELSEHAPSYMFGTMPTAGSGSTAGPAGSKGGRIQPSTRSFARKQTAPKIDDVITPASSTALPKTTRLKKTLAKIKPPATPRKSSSRKRTTSRTSKRR